MKRIVDDLPVCFSAVTNAQKQGVLVRCQRSRDSHSNETLLMSFLFVVVTRYFAPSRPEAVARSGPFKGAAKKDTLASRVVEQMLRANRWSRWDENA
jgi:hypothetical protein